MPSLENSPVKQMTGSAMLIPFRLLLNRKGLGLIYIHLPKKSDLFICSLSRQTLQNKKPIRNFSFLMVNFFLPPAVCLVKGCSSANGTIAADCILTSNALLISG